VQFPLFSNPVTGMVLMIAGFLVMNLGAEAAEALTMRMQDSVKLVEKSFKEVF
jgi:hypothetical protein